MFGANRHGPLITRALLVELPRKLLRRPAVSPWHHTAVSRRLQSRFSMVRVPQRLGFISLVISAGHENPHNTNPLGREFSPLRVQKPSASKCMTHYRWHEASPSLGR